MESDGERGALDERKRIVEEALAPIGARAIADKMRRQPNDRYGREHAFLDARRRACVNQLK